MKIQEKSKGSVSVLMTQERPGSTARGPQHVMMKLQIYNTSPHFGKACAQMGLSYSKAWRLLKSAEADLGIPLLDTQKGGIKRAGSTLTPQGEELLDRYLAFEKEAREAVFVAFEKHFKADDAFQK